MKTLLYPACIARLLLAASLVFASGVEAGDMAQHPYFKQLIGTWSAEGVLKNDKGEDVPITEDWTGRVVSPEEFIIEGTRTVNLDKKDFRWSFTHNAATDSYEAILSGGDGNPLRFEGSFSEVNMSFEMKSITGPGSSSINITESFKDEKHQVLETKVVFLNEAGDSTLSGTITNKKAEVK